MLFDLGGVLVDFSDEQYIKYLAKVSHKSVSRVKMLLDPWWTRIDIGVVHIKFFERQVAQLLEIPQSKVKWVEFYEKTVKLNDQMMALEKVLRKHYTVAFLSNVDFSRYDIAMSILDLKHFDYDFTSCYMRLRKPDPEIYRVVAKRMKLRPSQVLFIDNREENVHGAKVAGMQAIWFKGDGPGFERRLRKMGIKW